MSQVQHVAIGTSSSPDNSEVSIKLTHRIQHYNSNPVSLTDVFDKNINSPKSVNILNEKKKFYVNSLEGNTTGVYSLEDFSLIKTINHKFNEKNQNLFCENTYFDYKFRTRSNNLNYFDGKPVEGCFSHNGRYLWVTYYRRSYDLMAIDPSAVCIIDTETDSIIRVMPTGPLPKMISCSPDNKTIVVTHWGDNTIGLIDISSNNPNDFSYLKNIVIDYRLSLNFNLDSVINRDNECGLCLRGTVYTPDSKYIFIGKMGSSSMAIVDVANRKYIGSVSGMKSNMRHLVINNSFLYVSINKSGFVQKTSLNKFISHFTEETKNKPYSDWQSIYVGEGARTIVVEKSGKYLFAAINNKSKIAIVRTEDMQVIGECKTDSYPVGMDISQDGKWLIVTAQGKPGGGGNSVMIYEVNYQKNGGSVVE